jgi:hypothetical protein
MIGNVELGPGALDNGPWQSFARACAVDGMCKHTKEPIDLAFHRLRIWDHMPGEGHNRRKRKQPLTSVPLPGSLTFDHGRDALLHGNRNDVAMGTLKATTRRRMFYRHGIPRHWSSQRGGR